MTKKVYGGINKMKCQAKDCDNEVDEPCFGLIKLCNKHRRILGISIRGNDD
jgi:hypothetical protein